jgi:HK97 family phage major capsid protein
MSAKTVRELDQEAKALLTEAKSIFDAPDDHTPEEIEGANAKMADAEAIVARLEGLRGNDALKTINRIENSLTVLRKPDRPNFAATKSAANGDTFVGNDGVITDRNGQVVGVKSYGAQFLEHDAIAAWIKTIAPTGNVPTQARFTSPSIEVKTLITEASTTTGGPFVYTDRPGIVAPAPFRPFRIRDLITVLPTTSDAVEYVRITGYTNAAAATAEATATGDGSGAKPESAMATLRITDTIKTIAHWIPASSRVMSDAPQLRAIIDQFLRDGLEQVTEDEIVTGDGTGEHFTGILNTSGTTAQAFATNLLTTTRKAITKVRVTGRAIPNAFIFHPNDWETIDLTQDAEDRYYFGGPMVLGRQMLWGVPVVDSEAMTAGTAVVGDLKQCVLWDREQIMITVSSQHSDFFVRNIMAILAERRCGFGILRPAAIVEIALS